MEQFTSIVEQRAWSRAQRRAGRRVGFVPTMGALHEGHLSLIRQARASSDVVCASIFVNPTQFDRPEDFEKYPITLDQDLTMLRAAGCDAVFLPTKEDLYPQGFGTFVEMVGPLTDKMCAATRPGHFRGVTTIVAKLFHIVEPDVAVFGQKDLQQCLIIGRMVRELDFGLEIQIAPTVREKDGLAMSSRNRRLSVVERRIALALPRGLELANRLFKAGTRESIKLIEVLGTEILQEEGTALDYAEVVDLKDFGEVETATDASVLAAAVFVGEVRLIDHVKLGGPAMPVTIDD
ncbi:MAG TPA: pantoate--beta-alanine ligase [Planctomycetota bacterium]|nr:pantoate--beta-alanine ligase [Planctomycetota bacterium]